MMDFWGITFEGHPKPEPLLIKDHPNYENRKNQFRFNGVNNG
jgi:NADH:ubiquinone oxidoreductase subunit C